MKLAVRRALISVSDKEGLEELARRLHQAGVAIVSSGGTAAFLSGAGVPVQHVADVTGAPEMLDGRVKTLHPRIHAGILAMTSDPRHLQELEEQGIEPFQLVVVNLYPFRETAAREDVTEAEVIEQIDIGGPAMIRSAAKNHRHVAVVTNPAWYSLVAEQVETGGIEDEVRVTMAREAFFHTAAYDAAIVAWMESGDPLPSRLVIPLRRHQVLRYGENPHQAGAAYLEEGTEPFFTQYQGKEMSFNNYLDLEASRRLAFELPGPAAVIVKHTNPCGVATGETMAEAFRRAWDCDPLSAFGGVVALNRELDRDSAQAMVEAGFIEVISAPSVAEEAFEVLARKKDLRVLAVSAPGRRGLDLRRIEGGMVAQEWDAAWPAEIGGGALNPEWEADLLMAWVVAAHAKSNAIAIVKEGMAVGVGAGDQSRVGAAERAIAKAGDRARGAVAAGDAFFPFPDGVEVLARAGVVAIVAPGGSRRDEEVAAAAANLGVTLFLAHERHFRH